MTEHRQLISSVSASKVFFCSARFILWKVSLGSTYGRHWLYCVLSVFSCCFNIPFTHIVYSHCACSSVN